MQMFYISGAYSFVRCTVLMHDNKLQLLYSFMIYDKSSFWFEIMQSCKLYRGTTVAIKAFMNQFMNSVYCTKNVNRVIFVGISIKDNCTGTRSKSIKIVIKCKQILLLYFYTVRLTKLEVSYYLDIIIMIMMQTTDIQKKGFFIQNNPRLGRCGFSVRIFVTHTHLRGKVYKKD